MGDTISILVTLWWLAFFTAVGLCLGSFLNVVVYRLPAGLAVNRPVWSFCPHCRGRVAWYDNIPVLSFLRLGGRCRHCAAAISRRYPVVELMTAMMVVLLLDAFFIGRVRDGLYPTTDLNWRIAEDWPIFLAHVILFANLLAMSAIDAQFYWVDIRFTHLASACGFLLHAIWTPAHAAGWHRPFETTAAVSLAALAMYATVLLALMLRWRRIADAQAAREQDTRADGPDGDPRATAPLGGRPADAPSAAAGGDAPAAESPIAAAPAELARGGGWPAGLVLGSAVLILMLAAGAWAQVGEPVVPFSIRAGAALLFFSGVILYEASHVRESDEEIMTAIETEAPSARGQTIAEFATLLPAILAGAGVWWVMAEPARSAWIARGLHWAPLGGDWQPVWGLATAASGYVVGAGIGWTVRIVSNLAFGREAFGTGDIHMMAAAGCVAGWPVVLLGFMITCFAAVAGWLMLLPFKRTRAIPLGPWLSVGFLAAVVYFEPLISTPLIANMIDVMRMLFLRNSQVL